MKMVKFFSLLILFVTCIYSCTKYDEGSNFSLISPRQRLINNWMLTSYTEGSTDKTSTYYYFEVNLEKDGDFKRTWKDDNFALTEFGNWDISKDNKIVYLKKQDGQIEAYDIIQLKNKDLKVRQNANTIYEKTWTFHQR